MAGRRHDVIGHTFLVSISGSIVRYGKIDDALVDRGKIAYTLNWQVPETTDTFLRHRIETPQGGTAVYLRPTR